MDERRAIKVYLEVIEPVPAADRLAAARHTAQLRLDAVRADLEELTRL